MSQENQDQSAEIRELLDKVNSLEFRIDRIEGQIEVAVQGLASVHPDRYRPEQPNSVADEELLMDKGLIESNIFEYGLAWFGSLVLLFGIVFLSNFARNYMNGLFASLVGYGAVAGVFFLAWYLRNSFTHLSFMLNLSAHLLLYYITLRLYFFINNPVIPVKGVVIVLLLAAICVQIYFAILKNSELLAAIAMLLSLATTLFADAAVVSLPLIILYCSFFLFSFYTLWLVAIYAFHIDLGLYFAKYLVTEQPDHGKSHWGISNTSLQPGMSVSLWNNLFTCSGDEAEW